MYLRTLVNDWPHSVECNVFMFGNWSVVWEIKQSLLASALNCHWPLTCAEILLLASYNIGECDQLLHWVTLLYNLWTNEHAIVLSTRFNWEATWLVLHCISWLLDRLNLNGFFKWDNFDSMMFCLNWYPFHQNCRQLTVLSNCNKMPLIWNFVYFKVIISVCIQWCTTRVRRRREATTTPTSITRECRAGCDSTIALSQR